jgi:integrase
MLTDTRIKALKPGTDPFKVADSGGLHLLVTPIGGKLWRQAYRFDGKQRTLSFGSYPDISLAAARARREAAKTQLRNGIDPGAVVKIEKMAKVAATANTFEAVSDEWMQKKMVAEGKSPATLRRAEWLIDTLKAGLGDKVLSTIEAPNLLVVLRRVEARGRHETVSRLRAIASQVFRYGIATGRCMRDPASDLRGALTSATSTPRAAIIDPAGVGEMLRAIDGYQRLPMLRMALQLLALVFTRPGELVSAEWSEIDDDAGVWSIPGPKTKMRNPHRVPLPKQALTLLAELRKITGRSQYLFESSKPGTHISTNRLGRVLGELGFGNDQVTPHGFRAMASTIMNESGLWPVDVIELQLAHQERNKVRRVYNRQQRWPERVEMMNWWADHLDELRNRGEVVAMPMPAKKVTRRKAGA